MPAAEAGPLDRLLPTDARIRAGARMLRDLLRQAGQTIGRRRVATLMRCMEIEALYRKPSLSRRQPGHQIYPYLLREITISRPNHG